MSRICYTTQDWRQLPAELGWLTPGERARLEKFRFEKRRRDWLLGRWAAKLALVEITGLSDRDISRFEVASAQDGAPLSKLDGTPCEVQLSLSHSNGRAFASACKGTADLGCDIELVAPRSAGFVETFFTAAESERIERADAQLRDLLVTMIWSAKESTLKALRTGLRADTRSVEVIDDGDCSGAGWKTARTIAAAAGEFSCRWCFDGEFVLSIVTRGAVETPISVTGLSAQLPISAVSNAAVQSTAQTLSKAASRYPAARSE